MLSWFSSQGFSSLEHDERDCELPLKENIEASLSNPLLFEHGNTPFEILPYEKAKSENIRIHVPNF